MIPALPARMESMHLIARGDFIVKADGWQDGVGDHYVYEVLPNVWLETLTNLTWPG